MLSALFFFFFILKFEARCWQTYSHTVVTSNQRVSIQLLFLEKKKKLNPYSTLTLFIFQ